MPFNFSYTDRAVENGEKKLSKKIVTYGQLLIYRQNCRKWSFTSESLVPLFGSEILPPNPKHPKSKNLKANKIFFLESLKKSLKILSFCHQQVSGRSFCFRDIVSGSKNPKKYQIPKSFKKPGYFFSILQLRYILYLVHIYL